MHGVELVGGGPLTEEEKQAVSDICRYWRSYCEERGRGDFPWQITVNLEQTRLELKVVMWSPRRFRVENSWLRGAVLTLVDGKGYVPVHRVVEVAGRFEVQKDE